MAKWIETSQGLPKHNTTVLVEKRTGEFYKQKYPGSVPKDWWLINILRWLDEEDNTISFSLEDIMTTYHVGWSRGFNHNYDDAKRYIKETFNLDV